MGGEGGRPDRHRTAAIEDGASLAIHPGSLGDVLLAIPALRALRSLAPARPVVLAAQPRIAALVEALGEVERGIDLDTLELHHLFAAPGAEAALLDGGRHEVLARAGRVVSWLGAQDPVFVRRFRRVAPAGIVAPSVGPRQPVWRHLLATVARVEASWRRPVTVGERLREAGALLLSALGGDARRPLVVVHPGAGGLAKRWPAEGFAAALEALGPAGSVLVAIHRGPADGEAASALSARLGAAAVVLEEPALEALAGVLGRASLFLGNDSGISHLAAAVGTPSVILFTRRMRRWHPWAETAHLVEVTTAAAAGRELARVGAALRAGLTGAGRGPVRLPRSPSRP